MNSTLRSLLGAIALMIPTFCFAGTGVDQQASLIFHSNVARFAYQYELALALNSLSSSKSVSEKAEFNSCVDSVEASEMNCELVVSLKSSNRLQLLKFGYKVTKRDDGVLESVLPIQQIHVSNRVYSRSSRGQRSYSENAHKLNGKI